MYCAGQYAESTLARNYGSERGSKMSLQIKLEFGLETKIDGLSIAHKLHSLLRSVTNLLRLAYKLVKTPCKLV